MVLCLSNDPSTRLYYTLTVLFRHWYPVDFKILRPADCPADWAGPVLDLTSEESPFPNALKLPHLTLLSGKGVSPWLPTSDFSQPPGNETGVPPLSSGPLDLIFFLLSRYEEYLPYEPDRFGRFPAQASWSAQSATLTSCLADRWGDWLVAHLGRQLSGYSFPTPTYRFTPTYDLDLPWAYRHKPFWQIPARFFYHLLRKPSRAKEQWAVLISKHQDPFDTYSQLKELHRPEEAVFFILYADRGRWDKGGMPGSQPFDSLIRQLRRSGFRLGLHPSFASNKDPHYLVREKRLLEEVVGEPILRSRQHYLKLHLPGTYRNLLSIGMGEDWSMAYPDHPGFRAGTSRPFPWYDLKNESTTELMIYPATLMDGTLKNYLSLGLEEAWDQATRLIREVKACGGHFIPIWHNSSFSPSHGWKGWSDWYQALLREAKQPTSHRRESKN
jgi:hypothetical protein